MSTVTKVKVNEPRNCRNAEGQGVIELEANSIVCEKASIRYPAGVKGHSGQLICLYRNLGEPIRFQRNPQQAERGKERVLTYW